jgi:hypothetical protein
LFATFGFVFTSLLDPSLSRVGMEYGARYRSPFEELDVDAWKFKTVYHFEAYE